MGESKGDCGSDQGYGVLEYLQCGESAKLRIKPPEKRQCMLDDGSKVNDTSRNYNHYNEKEKEKAGL